MRFETTRALDAIERRLAIDPQRAGAVLDLAEASRLVDLDGGRPATLVRLGLLVDALSRLLGDGGVALYGVAERGLLSDTDLTANERMVLRRWSDDGLIELLPPGAPTAARVQEIAGLTGIALLSRAARGYPGLVFAPTGDPSGVALTVTSSGASPRPHPVIGRYWRCPTTGCPSFGSPPEQDAGQSPPALPSGAPVCPRHGDRLIDAGPRPWAVPMAVRIDGIARRRFLASTGRPVAVGRAPEDGVALGPLLGGDSARWVSRHHVTIDARDGAMYVTDHSTNGSIVLSRTNGGVRARRVALNRSQPYGLTEWDEVELHAGLTIGRADRPPAGPVDVESVDSVMAEAPTVAMRLPPE